MAFSFHFLCSLLFLSLFSVPCIASSSASITIPLSHFHPQQYPNPFQNLTHLAARSITRARLLKDPHNKGPAPSTAPLFSRSYGGYSIPLSFGTPPQTLQFVMDTGSDVVWFPCTRRYRCNDCSFLRSDPNNLTPFIPKLSSSVKILGCSNPKCGWIHRTNGTRCSDCKSSGNCTQICPPYLIFYGSGATGGFALVDTLDFPARKVPGFMVGCSVFSSRQPAGIAGFGRGMASLPSQLGLKKFSFCLLSREFDDTNDSTPLVLDSELNSQRKTFNTIYTPFLKNPTVADKEAFSVYYYVCLRKITVGGKRVRIPYDYFSPGVDGDGGTIVDSGSTFTYMTKSVFDRVVRQFVHQARGYKRAPNVESAIGLRPCFKITGGETLLPEMVLHFKGGAKMALPLKNYFVMAEEMGAVCLAMVTDGAFGPATSSGPAIILGSFQMQNFYVEYDLRNERFGFRRQLCK
ncbi:Nepenthesin [Bertholletia excelsa]